MANGWLIFFGLLWAYFLLIFWLIRSGKMQDWNMSLAFGFVLMIRTQKGKRLLDVISRPRAAWNAFGDVGIVVTLLVMAGFTFLLLLAIPGSLDPSSGLEPAPASQILVIPGVNPIVPLWYGLIGLIVTLVVHEGGHGVLARANGLKVKSLGLLYAIVPIGAFVEPDEDEIKEASLRKRLRVFTAGPMVNIVVGLIFLGLFVAMVSAASSPDGAGLRAVAEGGPADLAGIQPGDILTHVNGTPIPDEFSLGALLGAYAPGDNVTVGVHGQDDVTVQLASRWDMLSEDRQQQVFEDNATAAEQLQMDPVVGVELFDRPRWIGAINQPFGDGGIHFIEVIALPLGEVQGQPILSTYLPAFLETPFAADLFWPLANIVFWIFWLNVLVGTFNALPMLPLDGGHIFRDAVAGVVRAVRPGLGRDRQDRIVGRAALVASLTILATILIMLLGPRIAPLLG